MEGKQKEYICECGKVFKDPQVFNGHKSNCRTHLGEEKYQEAVNRRLKASEKGRQVLKDKSDDFHAKKDEEKRQWESEGHLCEHCGKVMTELYGSGRFCSKACANAREHTMESRLKASSTMKSFYANQEKINKLDIRTNTKVKFNFDQYVPETKDLYLKGIANYKNLDYYKLDKVEGIDFVICPYCNARMLDLQTKHLRLHNKTKDDVKSEFGNDYKTLSQKSYEKRSQSSSKLQQKLIEEGRHKGWQSRNIRSYAEQFWEKVLDNNGITYESEHTLKKKCLGVCDESNYFLDFFIDGFIDLEIDGKQHQYEDRKQSDVMRDRLLKQHGFIVYRIPWIDPKLKDKVKTQIDEFLTWYSNIKDEEGIIVY